MIEMSYLRSGLTPVTNPSDHLRKRVKFALQGSETNADECFTNPFALDAYQVTDVDNVDYDIREVLHYINTGHGYTVDDDQAPFLVPCPKTSKCVNPHHVRRFQFSPVSKHRFFLERNMGILEHIQVDLNNLNACWINQRLISAEQGLLKQLVAIAFGVFDPAEAKHLLGEKSKYGIRKDNLKDGRNYWSPCPNACVNPYHAPTPPLPTPKTETPDKIPEDDFEAYLMFKDYVFNELPSGRSSLICRSKKITYSNEESAVKARQKWNELGLSRYGKARVYRCHLCAFWHLSSKPQRKKTRTGS